MAVTQIQYDIRKTITLLCSLLVVCQFISKAQTQQYGWSVIATPRPGYSIYALEFKDSLHGWCGAGDSLYYTTDRGHTWHGGSQPYFPNGFIDISFSDTLHGWVVGSLSGQDGFIWRTTDGGQNWIEQRFEYQRTFRSTAAQGIQHDVTLGNTYQTHPDTGKVIRTTDGGVAWSEQTLADSISGFGKTQFIDSLRGWVSAGMTNRVPILRTVDGGRSWTPDTTRLNFGLFSFIDSLHGFALCGHTDTAFYFCHTPDGGISWQTIYVPYGNILSTSFNAMSFVDSLNGWMFGGTFYQGFDSEVIIRTTDGGYHWTQESIGISGELLNGLMLEKTHGWAVSFDGRVLSYGMTSDTEQPPDLPKTFALRQNYPNPFNPKTNIEYEVSQRSYVRISIFDVLGKRVLTLIDQPHEPGTYKIAFDGSKLGSGTYYYRMEAEKFIETKQLLLIK